MAGSELDLSCDRRQGFGSKLRSFTAPYVAQSPKPGTLNPRLETSRKNLRPDLIWAQKHVKEAIKQLNEKHRTP